MSDIGVSYKLGYNPKPVPVSVTLSARGNKLYITLNDVPTLTIGATPRFTKNVMASALSVVLTPIVNTITLTLGLFAGKIMNGRKFSICTIKPEPFDIEGVKGKLQPQNLTLGARGSELVVKGNFTLI